MTVCNIQHLEIVTNFRTQTRTCYSLVPWDRFTATDILCGGLFQSFWWGPSYAAHESQGHSTKHKSSFPFIPLYALLSGNKHNIWTNPRTLMAYTDSTPPYVPVGRYKEIYCFNCEPMISGIRSIVDKTLMWNWNIQIILSKVYNKYKLNSLFHQRCSDSWWVSFKL